MTLLELQAWLGHGSPNSTQQYAKITPATLTKAYRDAGYFERNVRTIEVLLLEAKDNLQRMLAAVPLTDDERAALDTLLGQLADTPTPAGPTPRQLGAPATATLLPIVELRQAVAVLRGVGRKAAADPSPP